MKISKKLHPHLYQYNQLGQHTTYEGKRYFRENEFKIQVEKAKWSLTLLDRYRFTNEQIHIRHD